jgi:hypothetical protein
VPLRALEDRMQDKHVLVDRARSQAPRVDQVRAVRVHQLGCDRAQRQVAEQRHQHVVDHAAEVTQGRRSATAVELDVAQPLGGGVRERDGMRVAGGLRAALARLDEQLVEEHLGALLGQVAVRRAFAVRPGLAEHALVLAPGGVAPVREEAIARLAPLDSRCPETG